MDYGIAAKDVREFVGVELGSPSLQDKGMVEAQQMDSREAERCQDRRDSGVGAARVLHCRLCCLGSNVREDGSRQRTSQLPFLISLKPCIPNRLRWRHTGFLCLLQQLTKLLPLSSVTDPPRGLCSLVLVLRVI